METKNPIVQPDDGAREANIGAVAKMPVLGKALLDWAAQIAAESPRDFPTKFGTLQLSATGQLERGGPGSLPVTYRVFGELLRKYCRPPRNAARCLYVLPAGKAEEAPFSAMSIAYNAYLDRGAHAKNEMVVLRTRQLPEGEKGERRPVIVGAVTESHSGAAGDDPVFIEALMAAYKDSLNSIRARYFRGVEVSELRAVIPNMRVELNPNEWWSGYFVVRNSEVGAASWSVAVGLHKEMDDETADAARRLGFEGATLTVEATNKLGMHAGKRVGQRLSAALEDGAKVLDELVANANRLAIKHSANHDNNWVAKQLETVIRRLGASEEITDSALLALAFARQSWGAYPVESHRVVSFLGTVMVGIPRRAQAYPLERLAGRVLLNGIDTALERIQVVTDVNEEE